MTHQEIIENDKVVIIKFKTFTKVTIEIDIASGRIKDTFLDKTKGGFFRVSNSIVEIHQSISDTHVQELFAGQTINIKFSSSGQILEINGTSQSWFDSSNINFKVLQGVRVIGDKQINESDNYYVDIESTKKIPQFKSNFLLSNIQKIDHLREKKSNVNESSKTKMSNIVAKGILYQETLEKVSILFNSHKEATVLPHMMPIQTADETLRLRKIDNNFIQLETSGMYVLQSENIPDNDEGVIRNERTTLSFKTVALYNNNGDIFVPLEIENICRNYPDFEDEFFGFRLKFFSLLENAVIAAFSMETYRRAILRRDFKYQTNDLDLDIFLNFDNEPQVWLDDKYNINHPIAIYFPDGQETINSVIETKETFEKLRSLDILQIFKQI